MKKYMHFSLVFLLVIILSPSIAFAAAAVASAAAEDVHPLVAASPARRALLEDPIYRHFQAMKGHSSAYSRDITSEDLRIVMDAIPMADFKDLWAVHSLLVQCYGFDAAQRRIVGEYMAAKMIGLKDHADPNMRSMAMYCWAYSELRALQPGQRDRAVAVLTEVFDAGISDYLKIKLAGLWFFLCQSFVSEESLLCERPTFEECLFAYAKLEPVVSTSLRPHFLWARARKIFNSAPWDDIPTKVDVINKAVTGSAADPYYRKRVEILGAYGHGMYKAEGPRLRIERLAHIDPNELPVEVQLQLFQHYLSIYRSFFAEMPAEELEMCVEGVIKYGRLIRALGERVPAMDRHNATKALLRALSIKAPAEAIALFDESESFRRAHILLPWLDESYEVISLLINGEEGVKNLPKARSIISEYEVAISKSDKPTLYVLMMETYASPEGFNEAELLRAAMRLGELASGNQYFYISQILDPKRYFEKYLQKLVSHGKANTALKVLNILSATSSEYRFGDAIRELSQQFLQDNPGVGSTEERQRVLMFIENSLAKIPMEKRFKALQERLEYLAACAKWAEARALYEKLLDKAVMVDTNPEWKELANHAIAFFLRAEVNDKPRADQLQERLDCLAIGSVKKVAVMDVATFEAFQRQIRRHLIRKEDKQRIKLFNYFVGLVSPDEKMTMIRKLILSFRASASS